MALIVEAKTADCCGYDCDLWNEGICVPLQKAVDTHIRHHDCPIIGEIPDVHGRLIEAHFDYAEFKKRYKDAYGDNFYLYNAFSIFNDMVVNAPTVLEAST